MSNNTTLTKTCTKCGQTFPATAEYFCRQKSGKFGLNGQCKSCKSESDHRAHLANREKRAETQRKYNEANRESIAAYKRQWQEENRERLAEYSQQWRKANRKELLAKKRQYGRENREKIAQRKRKAHEENPNKRRINRNRREARKRSLPDTFTTEQWIQCLVFWHGCCAVCGNQLKDLFGNVIPHADHWIPLNSPDCPGTVAENMICLCNSCNSSKQDVPAYEWLESKCGKRKAKQILKRIEDYFEWVRNQ
jgi:hypothetical protein